MKHVLITSIIAIMLLMSGCAQETIPTIVSQRPLPQQQTYTPPKAPTPAWKPGVKTGTLKGKVIVIDAGHGGKDPGTMGSGLRTIPEKSINLSIANELSRQLKAKGAKVVMTRSSDVFLELEDRASIAARNKADLFIAIHTNSHPSSDRKGVVIYSSRSPSRDSVVAAMMMERAIENAKIPCRTDRGDYKVLILHSRPSILVEVGYVTNYSDCKLLNTTTYRSKMAGVIAQGITNYFVR